MNKDSVTQNSILPTTNFFIYREKHYPFNITLFNLFSQYFISNQHQLKPNTGIQLVEDKEDDIELSDDSINYFIKFCHNQHIILNKQNVISIRKLAKKYTVKLLVDATDQYIKEQRDEFVIQVNQTEGNYNSEECEEMIASNFKKCIEDDELLKLPIHVLHRIVSKYFKNKESKLIEEDEIIEFLFRCLERYDRAGSVLFEAVEFGEMSNEVYRRLLTDYSNKFDFHFINKNQLKSLYELSNEIIQREEEIKITQRNNETTNKRHEEEEMKIRQEILEHKQEIERTFYDKIDEIKREKDSQIKQIRQEMTNKIDEIKREKDSQIEQLEQTFVNKIDEIMREKESKISQQQEEIRQLTEKVIQKDSIIDQLNIQIKELSNPPISCHFINESNPNGIISLLNDSVTLSAGGKHDPYCALSNIKIYNNNFFYNYYRGYTPNSESNSCIKFDFGPNKKIELSSYFIRSNSSPPSSNYHPKSWRVEGSNDESHWTQLDRRVNDGNLNGSYKQHHFECQKNRSGDKNYRYRYIRWIQEDSWLNDRPNYVYITYFELYGNIFPKN